MSDFLEITEERPKRPLLSRKEEEERANAKVEKLLGKVIWSNDDKKAFRERILKDPKVLKVFSQYDSTDIEPFIKSYIKFRTQVVDHERHNLKLNFMYSKSDTASAEAYFWQIQHKKLFEQQCLWRAGKINIPQIKTTTDFIYWSAAIKYCPFIAPVQPEEVELLKRFLIEKGYEQEYELSYHDLQSYDKIKNKDHEEHLIPPFYKYWDAHYGTDYLLHLPDKRSDIETQYSSLSEKNDDKATQRTWEPDYRPNLHIYARDEVSNFIEASGDHSFKSLHDKYKAHKKMISDNHDYDLDMLDFKSEGMPMNYPLVNVYDSWRRNIAAIVYKYLHEGYAEQLDLVYEMYCLERDMDMGINLSNEQIESLSLKKSIVERYRDKIIQGRINAGEPADWSFLDQVL